MPQLTLENKEHRRLQKIARDSKHTWYLRKGRKVTPIIIRKAPHPKSFQHTLMLKRELEKQLIRELSH
jgi:hypothetical protein